MLDWTHLTLVAARPDLTRPQVGLKPQQPLNRAGARTLPPISEPRPSGEPPAATRTPSPPEEPPGTRSGSRMLVVTPHTGLLQPKLAERTGYQWMLWERVQPSF